MHSLRQILLHTPKIYRSTQRIECERILSTVLCRGFSSSRNDRFERDHDDEDSDDVSFSQRRPTRSNYDQNKRPFTNGGQSYSRNNRNIQSNRESFEFEDYDGDTEQPYSDRFSYREQGFQNSRYNAREVGANIKKKVWDTNELTPLEKNVYVEHPSLAQKSQADVDAFYKNYNVIVKRGEKPNPVSHFSEVSFPEEIGQHLEKNSWTQPTPIQSIGWPIALSGKNMVGIAQTGSGKTLGFILPALVHIRHQRKIASKGKGPAVLVLAPTRELAQQIKSVAVEYGRLLGIRSCCLFGGQSKLIQSRYLSEDPEIVVATPGRLLDFMEMGVIDLSRASYVVLDEADRMLDMGFEPQIRKVLEQIRPDRQMLMWSATWPKEIQQLAHDFLGTFTQVNIGSVELMANPNIQQIVHVCNRNEKFNLLLEELEKTKNEGRQKVLIFAQTKTQAEFLSDRLRRMSYEVMAIHGDKSQMVRDQTLRSFKAGKTQILVATDVASRGLDVNDIQLVVNFDYPNTTDDYIHRIGRTARASKTGTAVTFITSDDAEKAGDLIKVLKDAGQSVPEDLLQLSHSQATFKRNPSKFKYNQNRQPYRQGFSRRNSW